MHSVNRSRGQRDGRTHSWVSSACSGDICSSSGSLVVRGLSTGTTLVMLRFSAYSCAAAMAQLHAHMALSVLPLMTTVT